MSQLMASYACTGHWRRLRCSADVSLPEAVALMRTLRILAEGEVIASEQAVRRVMGSAASTQRGRKLALYSQTFGGADASKN